TTAVSLSAASAPVALSTAPIPILTSRRLLSCRGPGLRRLIVRCGSLSGLRRTALVSIAKTTAAPVAAAAAWTLFDGELFFVGATGCLSAFAALAFLDRIVDAHTIGHVRPGHAGAAGACGEVRFSFEQSRHRGRMMLFYSPHESRRAANV